MISINWQTKVISIPQSYLSALGGGRYGLSIETLRNDLKNIEDSEAGMVFDKTHNRNAPVLLSGVTYAQTFEVINGYVIDFESTGAPYIVVPSGANHNLGDVTLFSGNMSLIIGNSAGLTEVNVPTALEVASEVWAHVTANQIKDRLSEAWARLGLDISAPLVTGDTSITFGDVVLALTEVGPTVTVSRQ